jgi:hypothetical protein
MGSPLNPSWYLEQRRRLAIDLEGAMSEWERRAGAGTSRQKVTAATEAAFITLTAMTTVIAGPLALIGLSLPAIKSMLEKEDEGGVRYTYHAGKKMALEIERKVAQLPPPARYQLASRQFDALAADVKALEGLVKTVQAAATKR